ncbi:unknown [Roseburia sp. CAG:182]|nr:unknown [Roseburia sp. CAG:182]
MPATREMAGSGASIRSEAVLKISSSFSGGSVMEVGQNVVMPQDFK